MYLGIAGVFGGGLDRYRFLRILGRVLDGYLACSMKPNTDHDSRKKGTRKKTEEYRSSIQSIAKITNM